MGCPLCNLPALNCRRNYSLLQLLAQGKDLWKRIEKREEKREEKRGRENGMRDVKESDWEMRDVREEREGEEEMKDVGEEEKEESGFFLCELCREEKGSLV